MKIICTFLSILALLVGSQSVIAQSSDENYVMVQKYTSASNSMDEYRYYDGLGRLVEKVSVNLSPESGVDLLESTSYDAFGHILQKGKPVALSGNSGNYIDITRTIIFLIIMNLMPIWGIPTRILHWEEKQESVDQELPGLCREKIMEFLI